MKKVMIEVELPDHEIKYCDDEYHVARCKFLKSYDYDCKYYCVLSGKNITKITNEGKTIHRPTGCRNLVKKCGA